MNTMAAADTNLRWIRIVQPPLCAWVLTPAGRRGSPVIRSPGAPASFLGGTRSAIVRFSSVQFLQLLANGFRRQGKVLAVTHRLFLALAAQDVSKKFLYLGIDRLFRVAIDVEKHIRVHGISPVPHVLQVELVIGSAVRDGQGDRL